MAIKKLPVIGVIPGEAVEATKFNGCDCALMHVKVPLENGTRLLYGFLLIPVIHPMTEDLVEDLRKDIFGEEE